MEEIINSVMQSPENTNPNVLRGQLQGISGGSGGGVFVVHAADTEIGGHPAKILDKTAGEIIAAAKTGYVVLDMYNGIEEGSCVMPLTAVYFDTFDERLSISFGFAGQDSSFVGKASTENDYPVLSSGGKK